MWHQVLVLYRLKLGFSRRSSIDMTSPGIEPAMIGGYGRQIKSGEYDPSRGGIMGQGFSSRSPPDIQPNTRIVAVCGITDFPCSDGHEPSSDEDPEMQSYLGAHPINSTQKTGATGIASKAMALFSVGKRQARKKQKKAQKKAAALEGHASPREDGWFFSDFFLFHHLFRGLGRFCVLRSSRGS